MLFTVKPNGPRLCAANGCQIANNVFHPDTEVEVDMSEDEVAFLRAGFVGEDKQIASLSPVGAQRVRAAAAQSDPAPAKADHHEPVRRTTRASE